MSSRFLSTTISITIFNTLCLYSLLLGSRTTPLLTLYIRIFINRLISAEFEVTLPNFFTSHDILNLYFRDSIGIMLSKVLLSHTNISGGVISIRKLLHFLLIQSLGIFFLSISTCQLFHASLNPFVIVFICVCCHIAGASRSHFKIGNFEIN